MNADELCNGRVSRERDPRTAAILGAAFEVHSELGAGFLEHVYASALGQELVERSIPFQRECIIPIHYKGKALSCVFKADLVCFGEVLVELKPQRRLVDTDEAQVINYLKATGLELALLLNFGAPRLEYRRMVLSAAHRQSRA